MALLDVQDLSVDFLTRTGPVRAVDRVSFAVEKGEVMGLVGESGSGKTVSCRALLHLLPNWQKKRVTGRALFNGVDLLTSSNEDLRDLHDLLIGDLRALVQRFRYQLQQVQQLPRIPARKVQQGGMLLQLQLLFPQPLIPDEIGLIVADAYGAEILRHPPRRAVAAARRKSLLIACARLASERLARLEDPDFIDFA